MVNPPAPRVPCVALRNVHPVWTLQPSIRRPRQEFNPGAKVPSTNTGSWAHRPPDATQGSLSRRGQETRRTLSPSQQHKKPRPSVNGGKLRRAPDHHPSYSINSQHQPTEARETGANKHLFGNEEQDGQAPGRSTPVRARGTTSRTLRTFTAPPTLVAHRLRHNEFCWTKLPGSIAIPG